jgi:hypothetical protein
MVISERAWSWLFLVLVSINFRPTTAEAQVFGDASLFLGGYSSLTSYERQLPGEDMARLTGSQASAMGFGGEATIWLTESLACGLHFLTMASDATFRHLLGFPDRLDARVTVYGADLLVRIPTASRVAQPYVRGGPSIVVSSGPAFEDFSGRSSVAGSIGLGSFVPVTPRVSARADVTALFYRLHLTMATGESYPPSTQVDVTVRLGVSVRLLGDRDS